MRVAGFSTFLLNRINIFPVKYAYIALENCKLMRTSTLYSTLLASTLIVTAIAADAQKSRAFAITGDAKGNIAWMNVREIDLASGVEIRSVYSPKDKPAIVDALSGSRLLQSDANAMVNNAVTTVSRTGITSTMVTYNDGRRAEVVTAPTETLVAASAYDRKTNRLFFTPMHSNELRYFDLNKGTNMVYYVRNAALKNFAENSEADVITRMCFGSDGYGYALTNDANHLIRFSSGDKITVTDLGSVRDGDDNEDISIRNMCTSWGGDLVADAFGNLYVISMRKNVFKINPQNMVADLVGSISNLPEDFMVNGAAVDAKGNVIVSSATKTDNYYVVNLATMQASPMDKKDKDVYNASDLASGNLLFENTSDAVAATVPDVKGNKLISVYPNPVVNKSFTVSFEAQAGRNHTIQLVDASGQVVLNRQVNVEGKATTQVVLPSFVKSGMYIIKVNDGNGKVQYSGKIIVF